MTKGPVCIQEANLSRAWAQMFLALMEPGVDEIIPAIVTVTGFANSEPEESPAIRGILETALKKAGKHSCETVANTIFPVSLWNPAGPAKTLFDRYWRILPRLRSHRGNQYGLYFERMIEYRRGDRGSALTRNGINQLDHIIATRTAGNRRRSALQVGIFDPTCDHTNQRQRGFPCLQQIAFTPYGPQNRQLSVTGFYAMQYLFNRAYGNLLGLCRLGRFIAHEIGAELTRMTCVAAVARIGDATKAVTEPIAQELITNLDHVEALANVS